MKLVKKGEGPPHDAPHHHDWWAIKKLDPGKDSQRLAINLAHYLPGGGIRMSPLRREAAYFVLAGSLSVKGKTEEYLLEPGDVLYMGRGEERELLNAGTEPATVFVVSATP